MDRLIGILWIVSAVAAGALHYRVRGKLFGAAFAGFAALAVQLGLALVAISLIYAAHGSSFVVASRGDFINDWMGASLLAGVVAFWGLILWKAQQRSDIDVGK